MKQLLELFDFQPGETVVSVGTGGGVWEIGFGAAVDGVTFYLVELDAGLLNEAEIGAGTRFFEKQNRRPVRSTFVPVIGTPTQVPLPDAGADKVLLLNSLHEFTEPKAMLAECCRLLKPGGYLFVEETLAWYPGERHEGCGRDLLNEDVLTRLVEQAGFTLRRSQSRDESDFWKVFEFKSV